MYTYKRIHEYAYILHTHTYTNGYRRSRTHTIIHTSKHIYANTHKHVSTPTHTCIHALMHTYSRTQTHTLALTHKHLHRHVHECYCVHTCIKNKNAFTDTTYIPIQIHSYANTSPWTCVSTQNL